MTDVNFSCSQPRVLHALLPLRFHPPMRAQRAAMIDPQGAAKLKLATAEDFKSKSVIVAVAPLVAA